MSLTIVDLFAGAGGLSCGFLQEGFDIALAVEKDAWAADTYVSNHLNTNFHCADIATLPDSFFLKYKPQQGNT
jgi:DNA (cytosine-5)-methyltransferase 1